MLEPPTGTIVISPSREKWNDFGHRIRVDVVINPRPGPFYNPIQVTGFIAFIDGDERSQGMHALETLFIDRASTKISAEEFSFYTMLSDIGGYRAIVSTVGAVEALRILAAMNDVVEAEYSGIGRAWLKVAIEENLFKNGFLRTTEAYFAWKNAGMILRGVEMEEVGRLSETLRIRFQLAGRPNDHDLTFRFAMHEPLLPKRFAVLIGKNGVGKSQTLGAIARAAILGRNNLTDGDGDRPLFNRILAFYPTAVASDTFPAERRRGSRVWYRRFSLGGAGYGRSRRATADLIVELARTGESIRDVHRFDIFRSALTALDRADELAFVTRLPGQAVRLTELLEGGERNRLDRFSGIDGKADIVRLIAGQTYPLSSGEAGFVRFAALASLHIENSSLLLFDEPETHLHPNFISQFVALLDKLLEQTGSAAIIATHSVYFVREAFEDQVRVLRSEQDRKVVVETPNLRTFGADVGAVSYFVFGEDEPSRLAQSVEAQIADLGASWEEVYELYKDRLSLELLGEIRARIEGLDQAPARS
ncbi:hypothetical protein D3C72_780090 [compost metagenome]